MKWISLFALSLPLAAHAEVMDKEMSTDGIVVFTVFACLVSFIAARYRPLLLLITLPIAGLLIGGDLAETTDPYVGPAMRAEAGQFRVVVPWLAAASVVLVTAGGLWLRRRRT